MDRQIEVFISYSSKDVTIADEVCQYLEKQGISCWIAPRNVRTGLDYGAEINAAIKVCKVVILIFSKNSNASRDVTNEVNLAFTKGKIIIPFKIEEVEISDSLEYYLGRVHWTNAIDNPESHFEKLYEQCSIHAGRVQNTITVQKSNNDFNQNKNNSSSSRNSKKGLKGNMDAILRNPTIEDRKINPLAEKKTYTKNEITLLLEDRIVYAIQLNANQRVGSKILKAKLNRNESKEIDGVFSFGGVFTAENPLKFLFNYPFNYSGRFKGETKDCINFEIRELSFSSLWERIRGYHWIDVRHEFIEQANSTNTLN